MNGARASSSIAGMLKAERMLGGAGAGRRISHHELEMMYLFFKS